MDTNPPTVYILYGEDEFGVVNMLATLKSRLGEESSVDLNYSVLEPGSYTLEDLRGIVLTVPFLVKRRMVVINNSLKQFSKDPDKTKFKNLLEGVPEQTALVIVETANIRKDHWLLKWANANPDKTFVRAFLLESGRQMSGWIQQRAQEKGGEISRDAASELAEMVGSQKRHAAQELDKLLAYTGYDRLITSEDVRLLSTGVDEEAVSKVFDMVDTLGQRRPQEAMDALHELTQVYDPGYLYYMIVRQFRFLILGREAFDSGLTGAALAERLKIKPWLANKVLQQARNFEMEDLEAIYRQLLEIDRAVKTSQSSYLLGLDMLIANLSPQQVVD